MNINYVAGLFDGEGYVYIFRKERRGHIGYYLSVGVTMCHRPTIEALHRLYGGHFNHNRADLRNPKNRCQFTWGANNQLAASFLRTIRPFVSIKADEIDVGLALQDHIDQNPYHKQRHGERDRDSILAYREELYQRCKALKTRSFLPLTD